MSRRDPSRASAYIGGMGARSKNYYNDVAVKLGYEEAAKIIQDLYLDGKKVEAAAAVPDKLIDEISLIGPAERIGSPRRLAPGCAGQRGRHAMKLKGASIEVMRVIAKAGTVDIIGRSLKTDR